MKNLDIDIAISRWLNRAISDGREDRLAERIALRILQCVPDIAMAWGKSELGLLQAEGRFKNEVIGIVREELELIRKLTRESDAKV